jgi:hypothetical protein
MSPLGLFLGFFRNRVAAPISALLVSDSFTDINGTDLTSHTPEIGGPYVKKTITGAGGFALQVQSNEAKSVSGSGAAGYVIDVGVARTRTQVQTKLSPTTAATAIIFRAVVNGAFLDNFFAQVNKSTSKIEIYEQLSGSFFLRASSVTTIVADTFYDLYADSLLGSVEVSGATFPLVTYVTSSGDANTLTGLVASELSQTYDDLTVSAL